MRVRTKGGEICILQNSGERVVSVDSVTTCSAVFFIWPWVAAGNYLPAIGKSPHPIWADLYCKSTGLKREKGGAVITAVYEGSEMNWNSENDADDRMIEVSCTMREEPIETHPDFAEWAGTPKEPLGAIFDDDGRFTGWNANTEIGNEMKGVKSYLYRVSYNANSPYELLISGQYQDGKLFSWICNPYTKTLREIFVNGEAAYKMAFFNGQCFYARRNSEMYEDRSIVEADTFSEEVLDYDFNVVEILGVESPTIFQMAKNLAVSAVNWAKSGFAIVPNSEYESRMEICRLCEFWNSIAYAGLGKCLKCGCTSAKQRLSGEKCPIGKW